MASRPNRYYPSSEFQEYRANIFRGTTFYGTDFSGTTYSGSKFVSNGGTYSGSSIVYSGSIVIYGFKAQGTIHKFQPIVFVQETGSLLYVSGATAWGQDGIVGVSNARYTEGQDVQVIVSGLVPFTASGATAITRGATVIYAASGSQTGSTGLCTVASFVADALTTGSRCFVGLAVITGAAAANAVTQIWVAPGYF